MLFFLLFLARKTKKHSLDATKYVLIGHTSNVELVTKCEEIKCVFIDAYSNSNEERNKRCELWWVEK